MNAVFKSLQEFRDAVAKSRPCPQCGCRLVELAEEGPICPNCQRPIPGVEYDFTMEGK